jgi:hypothetical protein
MLAKLCDIYNITMLSVKFFIIKLYIPLAILPLGVLSYKSEGRLYVNSSTADQIDLCALDYPTVSLAGDLRIGRCAVECNRLLGCNWFNYVDNKTIGGNFTNTACQLFSSPPVVLEIVPGCVLHAVSIKLLTENGSVQGKIGSLDK